MDRPTPQEVAAVICTGEVVAQQFEAVWPQLRDRLGCTGRLINTTQFAYQDFQRGKLIWRGMELDYNEVIPPTEGSTVVLYSDGTWEVIQFTKYNPGDPLYACPELGSTRSALTPKRGFGKLLCEFPAVREQLGSATRAEHGYPTSFVQLFERGFLLHYNVTGNRWSTLAFFYGEGQKAGTWEQW